MFQSKEIICAIELGTSKICVLLGECLSDGRINIIGRGTVNSAGSIVKGEIYNMEQAFDVLDSALEEADRQSGGLLMSCRMIVVVVTGCGIESHRGIGTVFIKNEQHKVTDKERMEAHENARIQHLAPDREIINSSEAFFMIDDRKVRNPLNHNARKLDAHVHVVHGVSSRLENFRVIVRESGFDDSFVDVVFAPVATDFGILSEEEREHGVLLIDFGAGVTEYLVEYNTGILDTGAIQVGFDHLCNDLSIGLDLPISVCRKMVEDGSLDRVIRTKQEFIEFRGAAGKLRKIPVSSVETIIDSRLREIFEIIYQRLQETNSLSNIGAGAVLTGGGALFSRSGQIFKEVFDMSYRVGQPMEAGGAVSGVENPRYSTVWGALKIAAHFNNLNGAKSNRGAVGNFIDAVDNLFNKTSRTWRNLKGSIKV